MVHTLGGRRQRGGEHEQGGHPEGQVDVEDPPPAEVGCEKPAEQRPGDAGETEHRPEQARVAAPFPGRHDVTDRRLCADHQAASAEALQRAEGDQLVEAAALAAQRRAEQEDEQRGLQHDLASVQVPELAVQRGDHRLGEQVGGDDPRDVVQAAEIPDDGWQRCRDDRLVECRQEHHEQQARKHQTQVGPLALLLLHQVGLCSGPLTGSPRHMCRGAVPYMYGTERRAACGPAGARMRAPSKRHVRRRLAHVPAGTAIALRGLP